MFLNQFNPTPTTRVAKLNNLLIEQFGIKVTPGKTAKAKLEKLRENADMQIVRLRNSNKKFQLEPEYAKYLGIRDVIDTMLSEGMYPESTAMESLKGKIADKVRELMDKGYTDQEASDECMNQVRLDSSHCFEDEVTKPMVMVAVKRYVEECGMRESMDEVLGLPETDLSEKLLSELAREVGQEVETLENYDAIEEKLNMFAEVSGKSRDAVVGFLNGLDEDKIQSGIRYFGGQIAFENKKKDHDGDGDIDSDDYLAARDKAIKKAIKKREDANESMFDDIIDEMITEEVDVEQAEVVMAIRALADDIQDQVERLGRMMNEDLPAIADQMRAEMGASQAQGFVDSVTGVLQGHLDATKQVKSGLDQQVAGLTGDEMAGGLGAPADDMAAPADDAGLGAPADAGLGAEEPVDNVPAAAGPVDEPMGRAEV